MRHRRIVGGLSWTWAAPKVQKAGCLEPLVDHSGCIAKA